MTRFTLLVALAGCALTATVGAQRAHDDAARTSMEGTPSPVLHGFCAARPVTRHGPAAGLEALPSSAFVSLNQDPEGDMPRQVTFQPDGTAALVVNRDTDTLTFFDVATQTITDTVDLGDFPVDVAVAPDGSVAVVPNVFDDTVSVVDLATHTVLATVPITGSQPYKVLVTGDSTRAVVGIINDGVTSAFSVLDLATLTEVASIPTGPQGVIGFFFSPEAGISGNIYTQFALSPDNHTLVLPDGGAGRVRLYDLVTGGLSADLATAASPLAVDVAPNARKAVVTHESGVNIVTVIDLISQTVAGSHSTGTHQLFSQVVRVTPDSTHAMVSALNEVIFVHLGTGAVTAALSTGSVGDIEVSFDGQYAFVANFNARVIDIATQSVVATVPFAPAAESAASPTEHRVVALNNRFREDVQLYFTDGGASFLEGWAASGEPPEADAPRTVAITPDGLTAVVANNLSRTASVLDLASGAVLATVPTGDRSLGIAVTPDGSHAVVCNGDDDTVSILDLTTLTRVAQLSVASRPAEVAISPDGSTAYVTSVAGADRVHFIQLAGAASTVTGSVLAGQMGSVGYTYSVVSGIAASPDGSVVGACISFADELLLIDAASHTELARVPVGNFPIRVAFAPDGGTAWVVNAFGDTVSVVNVAGAASSVVATVPGIDFPLVNLPDDTGSYLYVGNFNLNTPRLAVIDTATNLEVASVALPSPARAAHHSALDGRILLATTGGDFVEVDAAGPASAVLSITALSAGPPDLAFSETLGRAVVPHPGANDGVDLVVAPGSAWTDLGSALAGTKGAPLLVGAGPLSAGSSVSVTLANALPGSSFALVVGLSALNAPFKGGLLVPALDVLLPGLPTGAAGALTLQGSWPSGLPSGTSLYLQDWIVDPAGPVGLAASNAVRGITP